MIPSKSVCDAEVPQRLSKAKRRRLRKKKLQQAPREDGGEGQAELAPDIELGSLVAAVLQDPVSTHETITGSITITSVDVQRLQLQSGSSPSTHVQGVKILEQTEEKVNMADNQTKKVKTPQKGASTKSPSSGSKPARSPKVSLSKEAVSEKSTEPANMVKSEQKGVGMKASPSISQPTYTGAKASASATPEMVKVSPSISKLPDAGAKGSASATPAIEKVSSSVAQPTNTGAPVSASPAVEKTREEIMAERKAKKAEKAAKKGKCDKENSKPNKETKPEPVTKETKPVVPESVTKTEERAAKAAAGAATKNPETSTIKKEVRKPEAVKDDKQDGKVKSKPAKAQTNLAKLLNHLQRTSLEKPSSQGIHPAIVQLGLQYAQHQVAGSNARAVSLMRAMKKVVEDYETPPQSELRRDLESRMQTYMDYLDYCRPTSVSMANAMRDLKNKLQQIPLNITDQEAKKLLIAAIDGQGKEDGFIDNSSLVQRVLVEAQSQGRQFRVVVVGARPWREAEKMLHQLMARGLRCSYLLISAVSSVMKDVSKVLLGAHAILANGYVMARAGSSQVALIAHSFNVPVIVCCETYKFCDRVQTDAFVYNELGKPEELVPGLQMNNLTQCVLAYDVTPPELVSTVVTEVSMLPCSSVPVVLHMQSSETRLKRRTTSSSVRV
ncbi:hypothetical protein B566_EDAN011288 [Ephemera danica]|nr:hypothetical protein B566_EDAN011288 [Ephemera danica]